jgi:hypothetical protein
MKQGEPTVKPHAVLDVIRSQSRRTALQRGGTLATALMAFGLPRIAAAQATPTVAGQGLLLVQGFSKGSLFPTQGEEGVPPYTVILWDAADQGVFFADCAGGVAGILLAERVANAIGAEAQPMAALVASTGEDGDAGNGVWALRLVYGGLGADPGAVTYQGAPLDSDEAAAWLGTMPNEPSDGVQDLGPGFLILTGLPGVDTSGDGMRLHLA